MRSRVLPLLLLSLALALCSGCASYRTPGGPAPITDLGGNVAEVGTPSARFPVRLVLARLQGPGYRSLSVTARGQGALTALPVQALLSSSQLGQLPAWPSISAAVPVDPGLLPERLDSMEDLRLAAAKLQGDVLLSFTVDTVFQLAAKLYGPMTTLPLRSRPDEKARIVSQVSAVFIDVRTGFNYGSVQASASVGDPAKVWRDAAAVDQRRLAVEQQAFDALWLQAQKTWAAIAAQYN